MQDPNAAFELDQFFPYQVRVFYKAVSSKVSEVYKTAYGLSVQEWRIMAVLGPTNGLTATDIVVRSSMDKVTVSRAIARLKDRKFLSQKPDPKDGRRFVLKLSGKGRDVFEELVPQVLKVEQDLLQGLTETEKETLAALMLRVQNSAEG